MKRIVAFICVLVLVLTIVATAMASTRAMTFCDKCGGPCMIIEMNIYWPQYEVSSDGTMERIWYIIYNRMKCADCGYTFLKDTGRRAYEEWGSINGG